MYELRYYQKAAKRAIKDNLHDNNINSQLVVMATGTGKRLLATDISQHFKRTLFVAHREELIEQAFQEYEKLYPMQNGIIKGQRNDFYDKRNIIASIQTLANRYKDIPPDVFDLINIDEAHHYMAKTYVETVRYFNPRLLIGYSATPNRLDGLSLSNLFATTAYEYGIDKAVIDGYLSKPIGHAIQTKTDLSKVHKRAGDFAIGELSEKVDTELRNILIASKYKEYANGLPGLAFCVDIAHAINLSRVLNENGITSEVVVSDKSVTPDRAASIKRFKDGTTKVLCNCEILTEGFDHDDVGVLLMARPTESETLYKQMIGRGLRLKSEEFALKYGNKCIILDFVDISGKHSLVNTRTLDMGRKIEDRIFISDEDKEKLIEERGRREAKINATREKDTSVDLLALPEIYIINSVRMLEPATEKQLDWLKKIGVYEEGMEYTKKQASEFISNSKCNRWQLRKLAEHGYDVSEGAAVGQYQKAKRKFEEDNMYNAKAVW